MATLHQVCLNHSGREAVAKCPECRHFYCRECVTEHDDRIICAACLAKKTTPTAKPPSHWLAWTVRVSLVLLTFLAGWLLFYLLGTALLEIPAEVHDGAFWQLPLENSP